MTMPGIIASQEPIARDWLLCFTRPDLIRWNGRVATKRVPQSRIQNITGSVARYFDVSVGEIRGNSRRKRIAYIRHLTFFFFDTHPSFSRSEIGRYFGRDHATVIYGVRRIAALLGEGDPETVEAIRSLATLLGPRRGGERRE